MRTLKEQLNFFGLVRLGGSREAEGKRRKRVYAREDDIEGPETYARVIGFIPLPQSAVETKIPFGTRTVKR